jgi:hypothetical protein
MISEGGALPVGLLLAGAGSLAALPLVHLRRPRRVA